MATVRDLISSSLRKISILGAGENLSAEDASDGLASLNQMLSSWSADGWVVYSRSTDIKVLTGGVQTYTMGPGGDIDTTRPVSITQASIFLNTIQYPLDLWSQNTQSLLSFPTLPAAIPSDLYINNGNPLLTLFLYPVPIGGLSLAIYSIKPLANLTLNETVDLPPGYERALIYNLAVEIAPEYEREASPTVKSIAYDSLETIKRNNQQYSQPPMTVDGILLTNNFDGYWDFNIYGGF